MKLVLLSLLITLSCTAQTETITFTNRQGRVYENVRLKRYDQESVLWLDSEGMGGKIKLAELPDDLQKKFGVNPTQLAQMEFDGAVTAGLFREVQGIVYDLRKPQPGWVSFRNAKLLQMLEDENAALVDPQPDTLSIEAIEVKRLVVLSDTERFSFRAMLVGNFSYINKKGNQRVIRAYDVGRACASGEVPEALRKGELSSAPLTALGPSEKVPTEAGIDPATGLPVPQSRASVSGVEQPIASGTGFFITEDGYLITNAHVVRGSKRLRVRTKTETFDAQLVRSNKAFDLAVLKVAGRFKPLPLDFDRTVSLGDSVFTIGFPNPDLQGSEPKYTDGKVSSVSGIEDDASQFQVSVPIQPGNSGGALIAENGAVVGIVRAKLNDFAALETSGSLPQNVNYGVKVKYLRDVLEPIPGLLAAVKRPEANTRSQNAVKMAEEATAIVLVY